MPQYYPHTSASRHSIWWVVFETQLFRPPGASLTLITKKSFCLGFVTPRVDDTNWKAKLEKPETIQSSTEDSEEQSPPQRSLQSVRDHRNNWESPIPVAAELEKDLLLVRAPYSLFAQEFVGDGDSGSPAEQHAVHVEVRRPSIRVFRWWVCLHVPNVAAGDFGMGIASHCRMHVGLWWYDDVSHEKPCGQKNNGFGEETKPSSQEPHRCCRGCRGGMSKRLSERLSEQSKISERKSKMSGVSGMSGCEKRVSQSKDALASTKRERERSERLSERLSEQLKISECKRDVWDVWDSKDALASTKQERQRMTCTSSNLLSSPCPCEKRASQSKDALASTKQERERMTRKSGNLLSSLCPGVVGELPTTSFVPPSSLGKNNNNLKMRVNFCAASDLILTREQSRISTQFVNGVRYSHNLSLQLNIEVIAVFSDHCAGLRPGYFVGHAEKARIHVIAFNNVLQVFRVNGSIKQKGPTVTHKSSKAEMEMYPLTFDMAESTEVAVSVPRGSHVKVARWIFSNYNAFQADRGIRPHLLGNAVCDGSIQRSVNFCVRDGEKHKRLAAPKYLDGVDI
ncbi:hypothetical protein DFH08DRAFT_820522 [Mycena albidolilacea]|uniref:Uncharacterized protein n=1 Tax=Mycena albidolilacea TaxID=1033008 RepID=A0AAD6ZCT3_9AGAR|nr:hypothetical protein DFH08DRAFT_820522 [Mycena albidolilacea]